MKLPALAIAVLFATVVRSQEVVLELDLGPEADQIHLAGDIDGDGVRDLLWGTGFTVFPEDDTRVVSGSTGVVLYDLGGPGYHGASFGVGGDIDADGHADFLVGDALDLIANPRAYSGVDGSLLFEFPSTMSGDLAGTGLTIVPDIGGDGHDEIVIGAPREGSFGAVHVHAGADGSELLTIEGQPGQDEFGMELASAGDVDGDGIADLVIGVYRLGSIRVVSLVTGEDLLTLPNPSGEDLFGTQVGSLGDIDGDGLADVFVGGPETAFSKAVGRVTVFRGVDGTPIWTVEGDAPGDFFGSAIEALDDLDGDGIGELAVGVPKTKGTGTCPLGHVRVLSGVNGEELVRIEGGDLHGCIGQSLASAGDVNADGIADLAVPTGDAVVIVSLSDIAFHGSPTSLSVATGGEQALSLESGPGHAGDLYLVAGSTSGITPGFELAGAHVPLNPDAYFFFSVAQAGSSPFLGTVGVLDGEGTAMASLVLPGGLSDLTGLALHHAFGIIDSTTGSIEFTSNAVPLVLVP